MKASLFIRIFIKRYEGLRLTAYQCIAAKWTIGYGHTRNVKNSDTCTLFQADLYLLQDIQDCERALNLCSLNLNQNQFDALIDFVFNMGVDAFLNSTLYKVVKSNINDKAAITEQFNRWVNYKKDGQWYTSNALVARRQKEIDLFFKQ